MMNGNGLAAHHRQPESEGGGAFPVDDGVALTKSIVMNGVDTQLVNLANALPEGELALAIWVKYSLSLTAGQFLWDTSNGLGTGTALISGGKSADGGGRDRKGFLFSAPPPAQADSTVSQARDLWDLHVWTRSATNYWTLDTAVSRDGGTAGWLKANPAGLVELAFGLSRGWTAPFRFSGKLARMWLRVGAGAFADAATCTAWRDDPQQSITADHHWNPGDTPGDTTGLIQDSVGDWDLTGSGGLTFSTDVPT